MESPSKKSEKSHTFSCRRCLSSFSSRYVRLASTGVLKGFMIFLTATFWLVSWSRAELVGGGGEAPRVSRGFNSPGRRKGHLDNGGRGTGGAKTHQTRPKAPMPTGWRSEYLDELQSASNCLLLNARLQCPIGRRLPGWCWPYREVISKVVPKICARTNSAIVTDRFGS